MKAILIVNVVLLVLVVINTVAARIRERLYSRLIKMNDLLLEGRATMYTIIELKDKMIERLQDKLNNVVGLN